VEGGRSAAAIIGDRRRPGSGPLAARLLFDEAEVPLMPASVAVLRAATLETIVAAEFREMPGMRLTMPQVCRLWGLTQAAAENLALSLVRRGLLALDARGRLCRPEDAASA
jgi:hypothetical protein